MRAWVRGYGSVLSPPHARREKYLNRVHPLCAANKEFPELIYQAGKKPGKGFPNIDINSQILDPPEEI